MLEGYITPLLTSYIDKYVKNLKPSDLKLSFWGGDAVLRNLELRLDVLERELGIPLEIKSGCIRELILHIPWNAIGSSPVLVTIKDLEFVIKLKSVRATTLVPDKNEPDIAKNDESAPPPSMWVATGDQEPAPGYLQGYLNRIINNVCIQVQNIVVKVLQEESDLELTLNIGSFAYYGANNKWEKEFVYTDYFEDEYSLHKVLEVKDMAVNLHPIEMREKPHEGKGLLNYEPFTSRCGFVSRVRLDYHGKVMVRQSLEVLFDTLEFSVDEKQFCLSLHLVDWLLGTYYSSKKLKGRDENPYLNQDGHRVKQPSVPDTESTGGSTEFMDAASLEHKMSSKSATGTDSGQSGDEFPTQDQGSGWGAWLLSFAGPPESEEDDPPADGTKKEGRKGKGAQHTKTSFIVTAQSVTVLLKMTQHVQVPVFARSFTSPVMRVAFSKCRFRLDMCPISELFWVCLGMGAVRAEIVGVCPCAKKRSSPWRRTSVASATDDSQLVRTKGRGRGEGRGEYGMGRGESYDSVTKADLLYTLELFQ